jgi:hypothetical protein
MGCAFSVTFSIVWRYNSIILRPMPHNFPLLKYHISIHVYWIFGSVSHVPILRLALGNTVVATHRLRGSALSDLFGIHVRLEAIAAVTMKNAIFWDIKAQFVPNRRHYFSATERSRLMLCTIWGVHNGDYEECRLLGYKIQSIPHRKHITSPLQCPTG